MQLASDKVSTDLPEPPRLLPEGSSQTGHLSRRSRMLVGTAVFLLAACLALVLYLTASKKSGPASNPSQTSLGTGHGASVLRLKGTTEAVQSRAILAPMLAGQQMNTLTITKLVMAGSRVKPGELLVEFDRQAQTKDFLDKQAEYNRLADQVAEQQAKESAARAKDETELAQAESDLKKADLEMQKVELQSRIDAEKTQQSLEQAKATLSQLKETFALKRQAAQAAIRILEIQWERTRQTMLHAQANAELMQIRSPIEGVVVLNTIWKEGKMGEVQDGDQVRPGVGFMQVVDPSVMQVSVQVNQQDLPRLRVGQRARVRLDAYPELVFPGRLEQIAPVGRSGNFSSKVRLFSVIFSIQGNDPKLMPDLSAAVDVELERPSIAAGSQ